jgi:DNA-binding MarR family transcriptional regulator
MAEECLAMRIRFLNRTITGIYDEALRPLGVTAGQLNILAVVALRGPVAPGLVARRLNMEKSTLSRNVERMRNHGWLGVAPGGSGRQQALELLPRGRRLLEQSLPLWKSAQKRTRGILGQRGARSVLGAAEAVWSRLEA